MSSAISWVPHAQGFQTLKNSCIIWRTLNLKGGLLDASPPAMAVNQICKFSQVHWNPVKMMLCNWKGDLTVGLPYLVTWEPIFTGRRISVRFHHPPLYLCHQDLPLLPKDSSYQQMFLRFMSPLAIDPGKNISSWTIKLGMQPWHKWFTEPKVHKIKGLQLQKFEGWPLDEWPIHSSCCWLGPCLLRFFLHHGLKPWRLEVKYAGYGYSCIYIYMYINLYRYRCTKIYQCIICRYISIYECIPVHTYQCIIYIILRWFYTKGGHQDCRIVTNFLVTFIFYWNSKSCLQNSQDVSNPSVPQYIYI